MNLVIAADKFKGALASLAVCRAIEKGLRRASENFHITVLPLADGGDGLADVMAYYTKATKVVVTVSDPLFRPVRATYLLSEDGTTAFIEMAQASGLALLKPEAYNPLRTSTFGTGEVVKHAVQHGVLKIILGIGGSATNDCGIGMAAALGYRFLDASGKSLEPVGENLTRIKSIDASAKIDFKNTAIEIATDVTNYLTGEAGATKVYGAQKGATPAMIDELEKGMQQFAAVVKEQSGVDIKTLKGGGAAGGMGAGGVLFLNAKLMSGAELLLQYANAENYIKEATIVITGEGKLDAQTAQGKVVHAVAALCAQWKKPVVALCGAVDGDLKMLYDAGLTAAISIINKPMHLEDAMQQTEALLTEAAFNLGNFFKAAYAK